MKEELMDIFPTLMEHKRLVVHGMILLVLVFVVSTLTSHLVISYREKAEKEQQISVMQSFIADWQSKNDQLNNSSMRPVDAKKLDLVQTDIIFNLQANKVNLLSIKDDKQQDKEKNGKVYTAEFTGSYADVMRSLQSFHAKDALIGIKYVKLGMKNGLVDTQLTYKIYTKPTKQQEGEQ